MVTKFGELDSSYDQSKTENDALKTILAGDFSRLLSSREELGEVCQDLGEAQAELTDLRQDSSGAAADTRVELKAELEEGEV